MNEKLNIDGLIPDFGSLIHFKDGSTISSFPPKNVEQFNELFVAIRDATINKIETPEQISALFVGILGVVFIFFLLISIVHLIKSRRQTGWVLKLLKYQKNSSMISKRQELIEKSKRKKRHKGAHLWLEFDESLIEVDDNEGNPRLYNTIDAHHFFNNSTLASGITESRMLAAVPGFLTAIGVIGTFVGLQLGLSELNIGNDVAISEMKNGLAHVISGAKIAFMTSVWGVTLSVLFNIIEKFLESLARKKIQKLQIIIDKTFPRLSAESQLQQIADDGHQSRESLQGLAEKIGEKMQESLLEVSGGIQKALEESLQKVMAPAIDKLVDETSDGNQKALESLVENFLSKFGELGEKQRHAMDTASESVSFALNSVNTSMSKFLDEMEVTQENSAIREKELINTISEQVSQIVTHNTEQKKVLTEFVDKQLNGLSEKFIEQNRNSSERDKQRQETFIEQVSMIKESTATLLKRIDDSFETQLSSSKAILKQGEQLQTRVTESINAIVEVSSSLIASSKELKVGAQEINSFGTQIKEAGNNLSSSVTEAVKSTSELAQQNKQSSKIIVEQYEQMNNDKEHIRGTITKLQKLIDSADSSFENMKDHQNAFLNNLKENVDELAKSMTQLLTDYSEQANAQTKTHLGEWAKHTTNYSSQMNNAVKALSSVVDEMQDKRGA